MSIVERALKKIQAAGPAGSTPIFGRLVDAAARTEGVAVAQPPAPARIISINQGALRAAGLLPPEHQERVIASQYRQIKRPLVDNALGRTKPALPHGRFIMVSSAVPGEGKTFTSVNLAFSMARERDLHVLLIDGDVVKPQVSRMFGIEQERGLLDSLADTSIDIERLILATDVPNLAVLPAGTRTDQATELLASSRMATLLTELARRDPSRLILFDSSPLLLTTESRALTTIAGQIVIVVRAGHTPQEVVLNALSYLPENAHAYLILNQSVSEGESSSPYYGYGYGAPADGAGAP
jgi:exopolysaccharide/PEP-CTERM locus tyrosine autokinase